MIRLLGVRGTACRMRPGNLAGVAMHLQHICHRLQLEVQHVLYADPAYVDIDPILKAKSALFPVSGKQFVQAEGNEFLHQLSHH